MRGAQHATARGGDTGGACRDGQAPARARRVRAGGSRGPGAEPVPHGRQEPLRAQGARAGGRAQRRAGVWHRQRHRQRRRVRRAQTPAGAPRRSVRETRAAAAEMDVRPNQRHAEPRERRRTRGRRRERRRLRRRRRNAPPLGLRRVRRFGGRLFVTRLRLRIGRGGGRRGVRRGDARDQTQRRSEDAEDVRDHVERGRRRGAASAAGVRGEPRRFGVREETRSGLVPGGEAGGRRARARGARRRGGVERDPRGNAARLSLSARGRREPERGGAANENVARAEDEASGVAPRAARRTSVGALGDFLRGRRAAAAERAPRAPAPAGLEDGVLVEARRDQPPQPVSRRVARGGGQKRILRGESALRPGQPRERVRGVRHGAVARAPAVLRHGRVLRVHGARRIVVRGV